MSEVSDFKLDSDTTFRSNRRVITLGIANGIAFAAAPIFAILAGLTFVLEPSLPDALCATTVHASPLNGMAIMYALMSVFHSTPWVRLASDRGDGTRPT